MWQNDIWLFPYCINIWMLGINMIGYFSFSFMFFPHCPQWIYMCACFTHVWCIYIWKLCVWRSVSWLQCRWKSPEESFVIATEKRLRHPTFRDPRMPKFVSLAHEDYQSLGYWFLIGLNVSNTWREMHGSEQRSPFSDYFPGPRLSGSGCISCFPGSSYIWLVWMCTGGCMQDLVYI